MRKGGTNTEPSQVTERPTAPESIKPTDEFADIFMDSFLDAEEMYKLTKQNDWLPIEIIETKIMSDIFKRANDGLFDLTYSDIAIEHGAMGHMDYISTLLANLENKGYTIDEPKGYITISWTKKYNEGKAEIGTELFVDDSWEENTISDEEALALEFDNYDNCYEYLEHAIKNISDDEDGEEKALVAIRDVLTGVFKRTKYYKKALLKKSMYHHKIRDYFRDKGIKIAPSIKEIYEGNILKNKHTMTIKIEVEKEEDV